MKSRLLLSTLLPCFLSLSAAGCAAIHDPPGLGGDEEGAGEPDGESGASGDKGDKVEVEDKVCVGDGAAGAACEVTGDCTAPMVCINKQCIAPRNPDIVCDPIEGKHCAGANDECVGGVCITNPGSCQSVDECPLGFACSGGQCQPERDGMACADPGPGPDLSGTWKFDSHLHLRKALPGAIDGILDVAKDLRDLLDGDVDLGLPKIVEKFIGSALAGIIRSYVPSWATELVGVLGDMSDIIDDMRVESTVTFEGQPCSGRYRGKERWDYITFEYRGNQLRVPPNQLPGVSEIIPDEFSAWYSCGEVFIDRHRIKESMGKLIRWLMDTITEAITGYRSPEAALFEIVDCGRVASEVQSFISGCFLCPVVSGIVQGACVGLKAAGAAQLTKEIDGTVVKMSLIKRKGIGALDGERAISNGKWYGSLAGGDFPGEFTATRQ